MLINGIKATHNYVQGDLLHLVLECTAEEALAMDTAHVKVTTDAGDLAQEYIGWAKQSATVDATTGRVTLVCYRDEDGAGAAVSALASELIAEKARNADLQAQVEEQAQAIEELAIIISEMEV